MDSGFSRIRKKDLQREHSISRVAILREGNTDRAALQRLFIAMSLPDAVAANLARVQAEMGRALPDRSIRWIPRERMHLTLKFLGNVPVSATDSLIHAIGDITQRVPPMRLRAARVGTFPSARRPRVVWAGVDDRDGGLHALQRTIEAAVGAFTQEKPERDYAGHVTIARITALPRSHAEQLINLVNSVHETTFGDWIGSDIQLFRSQLSSSGASYSSIATLPLTQI